MSCKKKICAGDLSSRIDIIDKSQFGSGCELSFIVPVKASVWAKVEVMDIFGANNRKIFDNTNISDAVTHKITIRYRSDIDGDDLIKYDGRYFTIQGFKDPTEDKRFIVLYLVERGDVNNSSNII